MTMGNGALRTRCSPAGYYKTIMSGAIASFGWDMLLEAAADQRKFERVLDSFFRLTLHHMQAWAKTTTPVFIQHDDMVWDGRAVSASRLLSASDLSSLCGVVEGAARGREEGAVLAPMGALRCSWMISCRPGADGLIFEPLTDLDVVVKRYGKTHCIVGSKVDCRTLTFGRKEQIAAEVDATLKVAMDCPGFICAVGNHIPSNVPVENALFYLDYLRARWKRG